MGDKILLVEDEAALVDTLTYNLERQGYQVISAVTGPAGLNAARQEKPDLIILDIMLPGMDGFEVCRTLRTEMSTPVLMLTARDDEIDRVVGLEVGADDYLTKPFSMRELMARVKAMLRRVRLIREEVSATSVPADVEPPEFTFQNLEVFTSRREVVLDHQIVPLKPKEYDLLLFLIHRRGKVVSRDEILEKVWGWEYFGDSRTVDVHIRWLRQKLEADPSKPRRIITVRGGGYLFEG
jgi:DNA-binding response OmpR family regulator